MKRFEFEGTNVSISSGPAAGAPLVVVVAGVVVVVVDVVVEPPCSTGELGFFLDPLVANFRLVGGDFARSDLEDLGCEMRLGRLEVWEGVEGDGF